MPAARPLRVADADTDAGPAARGARRRAVADVRRSLVLEAARTAFHELGLEGASLREIARRAGYTPGAIYSYFASKEEVYGALLGESLERLNAGVAAARPVVAAGRAAASPRAQREARLRAHAGAFFDFYRENPRDLDLGFYLFHGVQPRGLTPALNEPLNARLRDALTPVYQGLVGLGASAPEALTETTALFAHAVGVLVLGHSGRIRMFMQEPRMLFDRYLDALLARTRTPSARTPGAQASGARP